jgi:hypothetical protein
MGKRRQILDNLSGRLAMVAPAAGWGTKPLALEALPAIAWRDTVEKADDETFGLPQRYRLRVAIGCYDSGSSSAVRDMLDDILVVVGADVKHNGLAEQTLLQSVQLRVSQAADVVAAGVATIDIFYRSLIAEPLDSDTDGLIDERGNWLRDESGNTLYW